MKTPDQFSQKQLLDMFDSGSINVEQLNHLVRTMRAEREQLMAQEPIYQHQGETQRHWLDCDEVSYSITKDEFRRIVYTQAVPAQHVATEWTYCPECGGEDIHYEEGRHKQCKNCHQEWFSDSDYTNVVRANLSDRSMQPSPAVAVPDDWLNKLGKIRIEFDEAVKELGLLIDLGKPLGVTDSEGNLKSYSEKLPANISIYGGIPSPHITSQQLPEPVPYLPVIRDRADAVSGHFAIGRFNPGGYWEYWNLHSHKWASCSEAVLSESEMLDLLKRIELPTKPSPAVAVPTGKVLINAELVKFLNGECEYNGYWFGDVSKSNGAFWWRACLPKTDEAYSPPPRITEQDCPVFDLDKNSWDSIKLAAKESGWIPKEYYMNDWVSDVCSFLRNCRTDRVTEQDAREIIEHYVSKYSIRCEPFIDGWIFHHSQPLLNKLNAKVTE